MKYVLEMEDDDYYSTISYRSFECDLSKNEIVESIRKQSNLIREFEETNPYPERPEYLQKFKYSSPEWDEYNVQCKEYSDRLESLSHVYFGKYEMRVNAKHQTYRIEIFTLREWFRQQLLQIK